MHLRAHHVCFCTVCLRKIDTALDSCLAQLCESEYREIAGLRSAPAPRSAQRAESHHTTEVRGPKGSHRLDDSDCVARTVALPVQEECGYASSFCIIFSKFVMNIYIYI